MQAETVSEDFNYMKILIRTIADSRTVNLIVGVICLVGGGAEIYSEVTAADGALIHSGHGVFTIGVWHFLKGVGEAMEAFEYLSKAEK